MEKPTKIFLIILGIVAVGVGIWSYISEKDTFNTYSAIFIGIALIGTVISIPPKNKNN